MPRRLIMIGVLAKDNEREVVAEFFELFKTPWEFYRPDHAYDVVLCTNSKVPLVDAKVVIQYGAVDSAHGMPEWNRCILTGTTESQSTGSVAFLEL